MDEQTLTRTYHESVRPLYRYVASRCGGDRGLAEDVTQETWLRAVEAWGRKGLPDHPLAWLKTVARNLILNYYRRVPPVSLDALPRDLGALVTEGGADWDAPDHASVVSWGLARIRPAQARLLEAFHLDGLSVEEVAREMGLSPRAVEGRLRRARQKLRKQLEKVVGPGGALT